MMKIAHNQNVLFVTPNVLHAQETPLHVSLVLETEILITPVTVHLELMMTETLPAHHVT